MKRLDSSSLPTLLAFFAILAVLAFRHWDIFSFTILINLISDNAFLGAAAVGMTFVILSGGIDLSVGAVIGFTSVLLALLIERYGLHPGVAVSIAVSLSTLFGAFMGSMIAYFEIAPFLVTLGGLFLLRGLSLVMSAESLSLNHPLMIWASGARLELTETVGLPLGAMIVVIMFGAAGLMARFTIFGRTVFAVGDDIASSRLLGLPVRRVTIQVYALSGFCAALAGLLFALYTSSGNATAASGLELDAIAAVVIGGTLLSGGQGGLLGTALGVLILGCVQMLITFDGSLSSWWSRIITGALLLTFILIQRLNQRLNSSFSLRTKRSAG